MIKTRLALFASGNGSNALNIIDHFVDHASIEVAFVMTNRKDAPVIVGCQNRGIECLIFTNEQVSEGQFLLDVCNSNKIDVIVLAGYLRLVPGALIGHYNGRIINIHPALLPKFGGKGMYGDNVHQAVLNGKEKETGITIHFVDEHFDEGRKIAQFYCPVSSEDSVEIIRKKVQRLEQSYFPEVIEKTILSGFHA